MSGTTYDLSKLPNNNYSYPNSRSYKAMRDGKLTKGRLITQVNALTYPGWLGGGVQKAWIYKEFQFNPAEIDMQLATVATDPAASLGSGGNSTGAGTQVGQMTVSVNLLFNREQEVYYATRGKTADVVFTPGSGVSVRPQPYSVDDMESFRRLGVQRDIYDVFRILLADQADDPTLSMTLDMTMTGVTKKFYDLSSAGAQVLGKAFVVLALNDDIAFYGQLTGLNIAFKKFNANMVPVWAEVGMELSVLNARAVNSLTGSKGYGATDGTGNPVANADVGTGDTKPTPGWTTNTGSSV